MVYFEKCSHKIQNKCFYNYNIYCKILKFILAIPHLILVPVRAAGLLLTILILTKYTSCRCGDTLLTKLELLSFNFRKFYLSPAKNVEMGSRH